ncbi:hypothetical protein KBC04_05410 [Candidatus Babeliales bacterium]|nr:hypothetical protein [Candidatus Babeliales bacterium]MBP9844367.1 hypothetical protein [Candidatus Babeliales bacterium]
MDQSITFDLTGIDKYYSIEITQNGILQGFTTDVPLELVEQRRKEFLIDPMTIKEAQLVQK